MQKYVIVFLGTMDLDLPAYKAAVKTLDSKFPVKNIIHCTNSQEVLNNIERLTNDDDKLLITILAHSGGPDCLAATINGNRNELKYSSILNSISTSKNNNSIILNLTGSCNSHDIKDYFNAEYHIDELWVTSATTHSLDRALQAALSGSFNLFQQQLDPSIVSQYHCLI